MATTNKEIILYDIPRPVDVAHDKAWSPNTWKARISLNYKGLPYRTVWVEYPDIEGLCKKLGLTTYSLPVIHDLSTGAIVVESFAIAEYLDATYPSLPTLIPPSTAAFQMMFVWMFEELIPPAVRPLSLLSTCNHLSPKSQAYFRRTRQAKLGPLEELTTPTTRTEQWARVKDEWRKIARLLAKNGEGKVFMMGDTISFADCVIAGYLAWMKRTLAPEDWAEFLTWHDGRWATYTAAMSTYEVVDLGKSYIQD